MAVSTLYTFAFAFHALSLIPPFLASNTFSRMGLSSLSFIPQGTLGVDLPPRGPFQREMTAPRGATRLSRNFHCKKNFPRAAEKREVGRSQLYNQSNWGQKWRLTRIISQVSTQVERHLLEVEMATLINCFLLFSLVICQKCHFFLSPVSSFPYLFFPFISSRAETRAREMTPAEGENVKKMWLFPPLKDTSDIGIFALRRHRLLEGNT